MPDLSSRSPLPPVPPAEFGDHEIPPAIACARCGQAQCDGCLPLPSELPAPPLLGEREVAGSLPWEQRKPSSYPRRLIMTALVTAHPDQACFKSRDRGSLLGALHFAVVAETLAILSFAVPWALGFAVFFPALSLEMMGSIDIIIVAGAILASLVAFVIALHLVWGGAMEWAIQLCGGRAAYGLGGRFCLYACGWDLLASPAGVALLWSLEGFGSVVLGLRYARAVPRLALPIYLSEGNRIPPHLHRKVIGICVALVSVFFLIVVAGFFGYLVYHLVH